MAAATALAPPPLLATQLSIPALPRGIVDRPRLRAALEQAIEGPLTLVCGPAGSGKTILLSSTLAATEHAGSVAWVSLNPGDDRPGRLSAAIRAALPMEHGPRLLTVDESPRTLVDVLSGLSDPVVLVLDDAHLLRARRCLDQLSALVTHPPDGLRLVLSSRSDPVLPLHLARLHGSLTEIRAGDLAFSVAEANDLLLAQGLELDADLVATLCRRTEGWAAGLRLAALGLQRHGEPEQFVADFAGDDRVVADYLIAEVLDRERPRRRRFLLQTSISDRLCADLADAITEQHDGAETLEALERENGFVVALDSHGHSFRFHRLFAELLRVHARREFGDGLRELHGRAARWHVTAGEPADALRHAALARDWDLATELVCAHWLELSARAEAGALRAVLAQIPAERREDDPRLAAVLACFELEAGEAEPAQRHLAHAAGHVQSLPQGSQGRHLDTIALAQMRTAQAQGRFDRAQEIAGEWLEGAAGHDGWSQPLRHAIAHLQLGIAGLWHPDPAPALDELNAALVLARTAGFDGVALSALGHLALTTALRTGPLGARELARDALEAAAAMQASSTADAAPAHVAVAAIALYERRFDDAEGCLAVARTALAEAENAALAATLELVAAELDAANGETESAVRRLDALTLRSATAGLPLAPLRARLLVEHLGDCERARAALDRASAATDAVEIAVATARLALAAGDPGAALAALERTHEAPPLLGVTAVESALLEAVAYEQIRDPAAADAALETALGLAEATGHRGVFLAAGRAVEPLLRRRIRQGTAHPEFVCELLTASQHRDTPHAAAPLLEPLSARESVILRYLPTSLSNREIACELFVTTNTVKTHLRSIYRKLGVAGRREAVERSRSLRLTG